MNTTQQPEALRLAAWLNEGAWRKMSLGDTEAAGRELRRQHAEITTLQAGYAAARLEIESLRAGRVQPDGEYPPLPVPHGYTYTVRQWTALCENKADHVFFTNTEPHCDSTHLFTANQMRAYVDADRAARAPAAPAPGIPSEADAVLAALASGEWEIRRHLPQSCFTDEANERNAWSVVRAIAPYCTKDGARVWMGATPLEALRNGAKALGFAQPTYAAGVTAGAAPDGWRLVPVDATDTMIAAFAKGVAADSDWDGASEVDRQEVRDGFGPAYRAMLAAAPQPPKEQP